MDLSSEKLEAAKKALMSLTRDVKGYERKKEKAATAEGKAYQKAAADMHYTAAMIERTAHEVHCLCVEAGLADPYPDECYGPTVLNDGWHEMKFDKRRPNI